jgi:hypothetical protein
VSKAINADGTSTPYEPGTRVYHDGQRYPAAAWYGTATIVEHFYHNGHLEYVVERDEPLASVLGTRGEWSAESTRLADNPIGGE